MEKRLKYAVLVAFAVIFVLLWINTYNDKELKRYKADFNTLQEECVKYRTSDSLNAISVGELQLKKKELEKTNKALVKACDDMNIKVKRLESASQQNTTTIIEKEIKVHDTLVRVDTTFYKYQAFDYQDAWNKINGIINDGKVSVKVEIKDTLIQAVYRVPRKFLFIKFGTKEIRQDCRLSNPYSSLEYSQYVKIK